MSQPVLEHMSSDSQATTLERPQRRHADDTLVLTELHPDAVLDHLDGDTEVVELITFGTVRECCPLCRQAHLKLVLRQRRVRLAHLFCAQCQACFDAHYSNGASALTI